MAKKKTTTNSIRKKPVKRSLAADLTKAEIATASRKLADAIQELESIGQAKKTANAEFKSQIEFTVEQTKLLSAQVRTGRAIIPVDCTEEYDYEKLRIRIVRDDTMAIIEERDMDDTEKQMELDFED